HSCARPSSSRAVFELHAVPRVLPSFPTRRSSDLGTGAPPHSRIRTDDRSASAHQGCWAMVRNIAGTPNMNVMRWRSMSSNADPRSEEHTSELQSRENLVCRLLLEKKKQKKTTRTY